MATMLVQVVLQAASGISADNVSNTVCVTGVNLEDDTQAVVDIIWDFYGDISGLLSSHIAETGHVIKAYDAEAPKPNYPYFEDTFDFAGPLSGETLPTEVALCLSFEGKLESGATQKRRRGRIYIGPLDETFNEDGRPSAVAQTTLLNAAEAMALLLNNVPSIGVGFFSVWSVTNQQAVPIKTFYVDNAWDTQRRRGVEPTARQSVVMALPT